MSAERRAGGEVRIAGRTLSGVAMPYGTISPDFRERFEPGAFGAVGSVDLNLQHDPGVVVARGATLTDSPRALSVAATLPEGSGVLALVRRRALNGFSVEFKPTREHQDVAGVRVVERAMLTGLALVDRGAYPGATAEVRRRRGRTVRQRIPAGRNLACQCAGAACKLARFMEDEMSAMFDRAFAAAEGEILAVRGSYGTPLASKTRGSVRGTVLASGDGEVEVDLPDGPDGDAVLRDIENTGAVLVRPYLDRASAGTVESRAEPEGGVMVYTDPILRSLVVGATDARDGWPEPELIPTPDDFMAGEERAAPVRRRRLWL